jgi:hypothetical protein
MTRLKDLSPTEQARYWEHAPCWMMTVLRNHPVNGLCVRCLKAVESGDGALTRKVGRGRDA